METEILRLCLSLEKWAYTSISKSDSESLGMDVGRFSEINHCKLIETPIGFGLLGKDYRDRYPIRVKDIKDNLNMKKRDEKRIQSQL